MNCVTSYLRRRKIGVYILGVPSSLLASLFLWISIKMDHICSCQSLFKLSVMTPAKCIDGDEWGRPGGYPLRVFIRKPNLQQFLCKKLLLPWWWTGYSWARIPDPLPTPISTQTSSAGSPDCCGMSFIREIGNCLEKKWLVKLSQR